MIVDPEPDDGVLPPQAADPPLRENGITIVAVEHVMKAIESISAYILVLHQGSILAQGVPKEVLSDQRVIEAYLGHRFAQRRLILSLLEVSQLSAGYGRVQVLWHVTIAVEPKQIVAMVGANGAGKTTLLGVISGMISSRAGQIIDTGRITRLGPSTELLADPAIKESYLGLAPS